MKMIPRLMAGILVAMAGAGQQPSPPPKTLDFYTIDVEGGKSVLIVSPSGESTSDRFEAYDQIRQKIGHIVLKSGDTIPLKGVDIEVVAAAGQLLPKPTKGGGAPNPLCAEYPQAASIERDFEDDQSIGLLFRFGRFRMLDLADPGGAPQP